MHNKFNFLSSKTDRIYFSGVLGASLSSLALIARKRGYEVLGSDTGNDPEMLERLSAEGIVVHKQQVSENIEGCDVLVYSAAISGDNPELSEAKKRGMKIFSRAEFLGKIISEYRHRIGVCGTHGKSTVSGMLTEIFLEARRNVTALIGAKSKRLNGNFIVGEGDTVIYEACEYNRSFLDMIPSIAVVTNIEREHVDCYPTLSDMLNAYREFTEKAEMTVLNLDDGGCRILGKECSAKSFYYSVSDKSAGLYTENIRCERGFYSFDVILKGKRLYRVILSVPGIHNVSNALAATAAAVCCGIPEAAIKKGLKNFSGMKRRMEYIGRCNDADVYDDYAHHPTEITATLTGIRSFGYKRVICAFQPHTYSRTAAFFDRFAKAFAQADEVIFTDIFAAREENVYGVSAEALAKATKNGRFIADFNDIVSYLKENAKVGTVILTLGAGKLNCVAQQLIRKN